MKVKVGISARHVHLTKEDKDILFGEGYELTKRNDISQIGQFACNEVVTIKTDKGSIENVRILGPCREYTQVEISKTDSFSLGLNPPVRDSGDLEGSDPMIIVGPKGHIVKPNCTIIATRHIHVDPKTEELYDLHNGERVRVFVPGEKGGTMDNVTIKCSEKAFYEMHIDTDDANAFFIKNGDELEFEKY